MATITPTGYLQVSQAQIDRCERTIDMATNEVFYQCLSESDDLTIYTVRYNRDRKRFSCSCKSGQIGFSNCAHGTCKHVRWSVAAEAEYKDFKRAERIAAARIAQEQIEAGKQYQAEMAEQNLYTAQINLK